MIIQAQKGFDNSELPSLKEVNLFGNIEIPPFEAGRPTKQSARKKSPERAEKRYVSMPPKCYNQTPGMLKSILRKRTLAMDSDLCSKGEENDLGPGDTTGQNTSRHVRDLFMSPDAVEPISPGPEPTMSPDRLGSMSPRPELTMSPDRHGSMSPGPELTSNRAHETPSLRKIRGNPTFRMISENINLPRTGFERPRQPQNKPHPQITSSQRVKVKPNLANHRMSAMVMPTSTRFSDDGSPTILSRNKSFYSSAQPEPTSQKKSFFTAQT
jgi:hypothetical protein